MQNDANPHKLKMLLVMAIFALPVVAGYLFYYVFPPQGAKRNYGELIQIETLPDTLALGTLQGTTLTAKSLRGKWILLQVDQAACATDCQKKLNAMRLAQVTQGAERDRVLRYWVVEDAGTPSPELEKTYAGTQTVRDPQRNLIKLLRAERDAKDYIYMIDPLGNIMMRWPANPDIKRMQKDIERLLHASQIG